MEEARETTTDHPRRSFLQWLTAAFLSMWGVAFVVALASYLKSPAPPRVLGRMTVSGGKADTLAPGSARMVSHGNAPIYVVRLTSGGLLAVSALCTHFRCVLEWDSNDMTLNCPCHAGTFAADGNVMSGLPNRPLQSFEVEERRGEIQILL